MDGAVYVLQDVMKEGVLALEKVHPEAACKTCCKSNIFGGQCHSFWIFIS
jgi:hypothetical protein